MGTYLFTIGYNNVINVFRITELSHIVLNPVLIEDVQKAAFWFPEQSRKILNGITFRRCVYDSEHLFQMLLYQLENAQREMIVSTLQRSSQAEFNGVEKKWRDKLVTYFIIQYLILLLHTRHKSILRQRVRTAAILPIRPIDLFF